MFCSRIRHYLYFPSGLVFIGSCYDFRYVTLTKPWWGTGLCALRCWLYCDKLGILADLPVHLQRLRNSLMSLWDSTFCVGTRPRSPQLWVIRWCSLRLSQRNWGGWKYAYWKIGCILCFSVSCGCERTGQSKGEFFFPFSMG